jgi:hypothetical protein
MGHRRQCCVGAEFGREMPIGPSAAKNGLRLNRLSLILRVQNVLRI